MSKRLLWALILMGLTVVVLLFNRGSISVDLVLFELDAVKSVAFLMFASVGIVIGILLK